MATVKEIKATSRPRAGKGAARAERRAGRVPGVIYGDSKPPVTISLDYADVRQKIYAGRFLTTIFEVDLAHPDAPPRLWEQPPVPVDPSSVEVEQVWYPSKDGTKISMFLVHRKGMEKTGRVPTLLTGYGGFNVSQTPVFLGHGSADAVIPVSFQKPAEALLQARGAQVTARTYPGMAHTISLEEIADIHAFLDGVLNRAGGASPAATSTDRD